MKLASIEKVKSIVKHPNADLLSICTVLNYQAIVKLNQFKEGDLVIFVQPDTILPDTEWSKFFKAKSNRVKAIKLRSAWSMGVVESLSILPFGDYVEGQEVSEILGIKKWEAPEPQDLQAKGVLPFGLPMTDEERYNNLISIPFGEIVDVTLKRDGKSWSAFAIQKDGIWHTGICGRRLEYKLDCENDYTKFKSILEPLLSFAQRNNQSIVLRGELTGQKIQSSVNNPHAQGEIVLHVFSVYLPDSHEYARRNNPFYFPLVAKELGLATVEFLETNVVLTPELLKKYEQDLKNINGKLFEGAIIQGGDFSFKVLSYHYDSVKN